MSSNFCSCTAAPATVVGTLTGGIQDIAALIPLLGTEYCEDNVSSALTKGYLYAAASPMSLFGSLGLVRAGLKTLLACFSVPSWNIVGARALSNMGFKPQGMNLSLIMMDPDEKDERYLVESRLEKLVEDLHIDKTKIKGVQHKTLRWNFIMTSLSALLSSFGVFPYIFLTVKIGSALPYQIRWIFPVLRVVGGFLTTITMQFIIQRRITTLARKWISEHCSNESETTTRQKSTSDGHGRCRENPENLTDAVMWFLLVLLLLGVVASIAGYVGCFSVVQSANSSSGPLSWFCLEAGLSLLRMFLWGWNPTRDDAPPLQLILGRDRYPPLPTCKLFDHDIKTEKVLPLTRSNEFLNSITSFAGVVERFDHPDVTLYYTLTRKAISRAEHVLYITIFDYKERANTKVYTHRSGTDHFYATESGFPVIDPKQGLLEIKLGDEIDDQDDPITSDRDIRSKLNAHYLSIMGQLRSAMRQSIWDPTYRIENKWTMAMAHTTSTRQREGEELQEPANDVVTLPIRDFQYLQHGRFEKVLQSLSSARGEWISIYMRWGIREIGTRLTSQACTSNAPTGEAGKRSMLAHETEAWEPPLQVKPVRSDQEDIESQVIDQIRRLEMLLVQEMQIWEENFWNKAAKFIGRHDVLEKTRLTKEWQRAYRARLDTGIRAMEARLDSAKMEIKASCGGDSIRVWKSTHDDIRTA